MRPTSKMPTPPRLGDSRFYYVTTASAELGVVFARSAEGHTMQPVSFEEVQCPVTKTREWRSMVETTLLAAARAPPTAPEARTLAQGYPLGPGGEPSPLECHNEAVAVL